ncbi:hypothetical protein Q4544_02125 [Cognatishimia sp. 1_MG-2023]|nr:hypothetical protein [Cognatishimia sp. 1_MG-2023]
MPEAIFPGVECNSLSADEIGQTIKSALQQCEFRRRKGQRLNYLEVASQFEVEMGKFRETIGLSERKFHQQLRLVEIEYSNDQYFFWPQKRAHSRFAFEGVCKSDDRPSFSGDAQSKTLGFHILRAMAETS